MIKHFYDSNGNITSQIVGNIVIPKIIGQPVERIVDLAQVATFSVVVEDASGVTFQWQFNGADIPGETGDSLVISNVSVANEGQYAVVVTNSLGSVTSAPALLQLAAGAGLPDRWDRKQLIAYSDAGGSVTVNPMKLDYELGEVVTLTAVAFAPYVFSGWAGDLQTGDLLNTSNPVTFTLNKNKTIRAKFAAPVPIPPGLVACWRGETDASDLLGEHSGKFYVNKTETTPTVTAFGKVEGAFTFDGRVHITVTDSVALKPAQITLEAWVFPTMLSGDHQTIIACGSAHNNTDTWYLGLLNGRTRFWSHGLQLLEAPPVIPVNEWTHLAATFDGATKRIYINGVAAIQLSGLGAWEYEASAAPVTIATDWESDTAVYLFHGRLDEVAIYDRALTPDEITDIYNAGFVGKNFSQPYITALPSLSSLVLGNSFTQQITTKLGTAPISFSLSAGALPPGLTLTATGLVSGTPSAPGVYDFTVQVTDAAGLSNEQLSVLRVLQPIAPPSGLVAWWRGEPAANGLAADIIGGHEGEFFVGVTAVAAAHTPEGQVGGAFIFDGTQYVQVPDVPELHPPTVTVEAWVYPTLLSNNWQTIIACGSATNQDDTWFLGLFNGKPQFWSNHINSGMQLLEGPSTLPLNEWIHLAATFDGLTKRLYVNGVEVAKRDVLDALIYDLAAVPVTIGADWGANLPIALFKGRLDEVSLYRRALSAAEIFSIVDAGPAGKSIVGL